VELTYHEQPGAGAWWDDDYFNFEFQSDEDGFDPGQDIFENNAFNYLLGAVGFNLSFRLAGLDLNWTFSQRTNFETFSNSYDMDFWIGRNF
jgi:hypothetical protein